MVATSQLHVALVEDDPAVRQAIVRLLSGAGHTVRSCGSAEEFLASDLLPWASCLLLDVHLPAMDGLTLLGRIRSGPHAAGVVMMTADHELAAAQAGRIDAPVLVKPLDEHTLLAALDSVARPPR